MHGWRKEIETNDLRNYFVMKRNKVHSFSSLLNYILIFSVAATLGFILIWRAKRLFLFIKPELLRRNIVTFLIGLCFLFALGHLIPDFRNVMEHFGPVKGFVMCSLIVFADVIIPYNMVLFITESKRFDHISFTKQQVFIFCSIVVSSMIINGILNVWINDGTQNLKYSVLWSFYMAGFGSLIYLFARQYDEDKKKKLYAKELELARLSEAKTKAELDALHSKINPHFLYNALNSIADLSVTDGKKARQMTIALSQLFRRSINYNQDNLATLKEEIETTKLYLEIEIVRFEDQLKYEMHVEESILNVLIPKFLVQPLVENAVKHGLKKTLQMTLVKLWVLKQNADVYIRVEDNGPPFPEQLIPGYGLKSVHDKLDLLFPGRFEIKTINQPTKYIEVVLKDVTDD